MTHRDRTGNGALIEMLDEAIGRGDVSRVTASIAAGLRDLASRREIRLAEAMVEVLPHTYARRLLHRCPRTGYTAVVMTWGPGQQTPLHDHAGMWCVECVVEGELDVEQYELLERREARCRFDRREVVRAKIGDSGCLIPPFEYHRLRNALADRRSVSLHVYAGEMDHCHAYLPRDGGWWELVEKRLEYHP